MDLTRTASLPTAAVRSRLAAEWRLKLVGLPVFIAVFFTAYILLLRFPLFPVTTVPRIFFDRWIPFQPASLGLYLSLWVYVSLEPSLMETRTELLTYLKFSAGLALTGLAFFFFWPTSTPMPVDIVWSEHPGFLFLKQVDSSQNACPSLHVAFAVFSAWRLQRRLVALGFGWGLRILNLGWGLGIIYSTLATRQHVAIDVLGGAILGAGAAILSFRVGSLRVRAREHR